MKKAILAGFTALLLSAIPLSASAVQTIDSPHVNIDNDAAIENCSKCHFAADAYTCESCHTSTLNGGFGVGPTGDNTVAPIAKTHGGRAPQYNCTVCHNPHVSRQFQNSNGATPLAFGTATVDATALPTTPPTMTFDIVKNVSSAWASDSWAAKTGTDRGLIFWVSVPSGAADDTNTPNHDESKDNYSFEVTSATDTSITVFGELPPDAAPISANSPFELHYGGLIARAVNPQELNAEGKPASYRDADQLADAVTFPMDAGSNLLVNTGGGTGDGICQGCHARPGAVAPAGHWQSGNTTDTHNPGASCLACHPHATGFMVSACDACHGRSNAFGAPKVYPTDMPTPASGSQTAGAHAKHVEEYGMTTCFECHTGSGMDKADQENIIKDDGIQIGLNAPVGFGYNTEYVGQSYVTTYAPTNHTKVNGSTVGPVTGGGLIGNGSLTCSNVYCHSNGYASGYTDHSDGSTSDSRCVVSTPNTSPAWDAVGPLSCTSCHDNGSGPSNVTFANYNSHKPHSFGIGCDTCHNATSTDGLTVTNKVYHANGKVDIKGGNGYGITWNPTTHQCSSITKSGTNNLGCHLTASSSPRTWKNLNNNYFVGDEVVCPDPCDPITGDPSLCQNVDPVAATTCSAIGANTLVVVNNSYDLDYNDPMKSRLLGGGHDGSPGLMNVFWPGKATPNDYMWQNLTDVPQGIAHVSSLKTSELEDVNGDGSYYRGWYIFAQADNSPGSSGRMLSSPKVPGGWAESIWMGCDMGTGSDPVNDPVIINNTSAWLGGNTIQVTDKSLDPDWDDTAKGHNPLTPAYIGIFYNTGGVVWVPFIIDNDPLTDNVLPSFTVPEAVIDTASSGNGDRWAWWNYTIYENHYYNVGDTGYNISTGWQFTVLK